MGAIAPQQAPLTTTLCLHTHTSGELSPSKGSQLHDVADLTSKKHGISLKSAFTLSRTVRPHHPPPRGTVALCPPFFPTQPFLNHSSGHHTAGPHVPRECGGQPCAVQTRDVLAVTGTGSSTQQETQTLSKCDCWRLPWLQAVTSQGVPRSQGGEGHAHLLRVSQPLSCCFSDRGGGVPSPFFPTLGHWQEAP